MKIFLLLLILGIFLSCGSESYSKLRIINKSGTKIVLYSYFEESKDTFACFFLENKKDTIYEFIRRNKGCYSGLGCVTSTMFLYFNDSIKVTMYFNEHREGIYGDSSILLGEAWRMVSKKEHRHGNSCEYEYEFTPWHYQKALEANGYTEE